MPDTEPKADTEPNSAQVGGSRDPARMHRFDELTEPLAQAVMQYALERIRLDPPPLDKPRSPAELDRFGPTVTAHGIGGMNALRLFCEELAPGCIAQDHPRNVAFVPGAPTEAAVLFDLIVGASSVYGGSWMEGSGAVWAENQALRWIADLAGFPTGAGGVFLSGGSAGNLSALVTARDAARRSRRDRGSADPRWLVAAGGGVHASIDAAARVMDVDVLRVPADEQGRMTADALRRTLDEHAERRSDGVVFAVVATAGTTNAGVLDDLAGIAPLCQERGLWLHVDGAYGGAALAAPSARPRFHGIEAADSFVVDPHKWLFSPYDCAALIYRQPALAARAHAQHAGYLDVLHETGEWNPSDYAYHLSRRARGLPFWFSLAMHGTEAYADAVEASLTMARTAARMIERRIELELLQEPELSVVLFRRRGWSHDDYQGWSLRLLQSGLAFCVPTRWHEETVLRFCFVHPRTTADDVAAILDTLGGG